jgi:hypothetical protein
VSRTLAALVVLALGTGPVSPAPTLKGEKEVLYFPTADGVKRVYEMRIGDNTIEIIEVVTKVEKKDGVWRVGLGREVDGEVQPMTTVRVSDKGVFRVATAGRELPAPHPLLKLPAKPGDTWEWEQEGPPGAGTRKITYKVGKEEEVEVPAGKFKAIPVEAVIDQAGRVEKVTYWHAPGVGIVKFVSNSGAPERTQVLKSFTPGK